jgi:large subunit ribosomal protein L3
MIGILGKKIGMTSIFSEEGKSVPVTVIEAGPCHIIQVKTKASDGYDAIQIGFGVKREKLATKPQLGHYKKAGVKPPRYVREVRVADAAQYKVGQKIEADIFSKGDYVDVVGTSIGRGFQGGVKRWGWAGGDQGHGSMFHRAIGSIQSGARLNRVTKGHHMAGHMGSDRITVQDLEVLEVNKDNSMMVVKGCVPGHKNSYLMVTEARKRPKGFVKKKIVQHVSKKSAKAAAKAAVAGKH